MSDTEDIFGFQEVEDGLDIEAIFGSNIEAPSDPIPTPPEPQPTTSVETLKQSEEVPVSASGTMPMETKAETEKVAVTGTAASEKPKDAESEPDLFAAFAEEPEKPESKADTAQTQATPPAEQQVSLFDKPPIFKYGSAKEPIKDASITFEELRIGKADDFPELEDGKKVSWSVKYGDVTKSISLPKETTIAKVKEEIEKSKSFLESLKKGKVKDPECFVTPKVIAGSKGIAAYRGVFPSVEAARASDKVICLIPSSNGKIYELRKTELGEFTAPKNNITDFSEVRAGFAPALPLIPKELVGQLISFFRSFMGKRGEFEALAFVYWDRQEEEFVLYIPRQTSSKAHIGFHLEDDTFPDDRYLHYADIHSHNSMAARFSVIDDADERATRLYIVIGSLNRFYPDICARVSCGGTYLEIDPSDVIEGVGEEFPSEWLDQVELMGQHGVDVYPEDSIPFQRKKLQVIIR